MLNKKYIFWVTLLALAFGSSVSLAASTPVAAPMVPTQNTAAPAPLEIDSTTPLNVEVKEVQGQVSVKAGDVLHSGDIVKTEQGTCRLFIDGKAELFLAPFTTLRVTEALRNNVEKTDSTRLAVDFGKLRVSLPKLKDGSTFEVYAPTAVAVVRGTTLYLNVSDLLAQLYVNESQGGVLFKNIATGKSFLVPAFSLSTSYKDGNINEPKGLTKEEQEEFVQNWQDPASNPSQQFGVEVISTPPPAPLLAPGLVETQIDDAIQDRLSEQNIAEANGFASSSTKTQPNLDEQEVAMIRQEIARMREDQAFDQTDANLEQIRDKTIGKVFTDVLGNRVRTDQYIFAEPDLGEVSFLSLTARTDPSYQTGVSSVLFATAFNRAFDSETDLRALPWNDYMHVVSREDVAANLGIEPGTFEFNALFEQYILHEHDPALAEGAGEAAPFFPVRFLATFTNPNTDTVQLSESYTFPFLFDLESADGLQSVPAQGLLFDSIMVAPASGGSVEIDRVFGGVSALIVNGESFGIFFDNANDSGDGSQTASFAENFDPSKLLDINYYRNLAANNDGNPLNDEHPAYFTTSLNDRLGVDSEAVLGRNQLIGALVPINDLGQIIDKPGFTIDGLRGLLSPNPLVNGGNYNLELILIYGYVDDSSDNGVFHEDFRIDTIITPEIFTDFYSQQNSTPSIFPPALRLDEDDLGVPQQT